MLVAHLKTGIVSIPDRTSLIVAIHAFSDLDKRIIHRHVSSPLQRCKRRRETVVAVVSVFRDLIGFLRPDDAHAEYRHWCYRRHHVERLVHAGIAVIRAAVGTDPIEIDIASIGAVEGIRRQAQLGGIGVRVEIEIVNHRERAEDLLLAGGKAYRTANRRWRDGLERSRAYLPRPGNCIGLEIQIAIRFRNAIGEECAACDVIKHYVSQAVRRRRRSGHRTEITQNRRADLRDWNVERCPVDVLFVSIRHDDFRTVASNDRTAIIVGAGSCVFS